MSWFRQWRPYQSVAQRRAKALAHAKKQTLRAQIDAAQTVEDVEAVTW